ncbi:MAG TPA: hypothetical protein VFZ48_03060 [Candidatus Saccharimonadales bacterium]
MFCRYSFGVSGAEDLLDKSEELLDHWKAFRSVAGNKANIAQWLSATYAGENLRVEIHQAGSVVEHYLYRPRNNERRELHLIALFIANWQSIMLHNARGPRPRNQVVNEATARKASKELGLGKWVKPALKHVQGISCSHLALLVTVGLDHELATQHDYTMLLDGIIAKNGKLQRLREIPELFEHKFG